MTKQTILKFIILLFLTSLIILSPLFIGSVEPFSNMMLRLQIALIFIIWLIYNYFYENLHINGLKFHLLILFIFICILQIIPLPSFIVKILSPSAHEIWNFNTYLFDKFEGFSATSFQTISLVPHYSTNKLISILCYILLGFVVSKTIKTNRNIKLLLYVFAFMVLIESMLGCYQFLTGNTFFDINKKHIATGTFVNKNHLSGFFELSCPLLIGYLFYLIFFSEVDNKSIASVSFKTAEIAVFGVISGFSLIVFIFTFSRLGYISLFFSILISFLIYIRSYGKINRKTFVPLLFIVFFLFFGIYKSFDIFSDRVSLSNIDIKGRTIVFKDSIDVIKDYPILGSGLGTFKEIYPAYKTLELAVTVNFTHNDYLQLAVETGLIGISILIVALILFFRSTLQKLKFLYKREDKFLFFVKLGCLTGIISILIHSFGDFNLHIPSNAVYFAILFGIISSDDTTDKKIIIKKKKKILKKETIALHGE